MNKVEAIIRPEKPNDVKEALAEVGLIGLNVVNVTCRGAQRGVTSGGSRGVGRYEIDILPKVKLELVVMMTPPRKPSTQSLNTPALGISAMARSSSFQ